MRRSRPAQAGPKSVCQEDFERRLASRCVYLMSESTKEVRMNLTDDAETVPLAFDMLPPPHASRPLGVNTLRMARRWSRPRWALAGTCFMASCLVGFLAAAAALHGSPAVPALSAQHLEMNAAPPAPMEDDNDWLAPLPVKPRELKPAATPKRTARRAPSQDPFSSRH